MSIVGMLKRVDATMRGSSVKDFNLTGTFGRQAPGWLPLQVANCL
jgi:hypothetical protein